MYVHQGDLLHLHPVRLSKCRPAEAFQNLWYLTLGFKSVYSRQHGKTPVQETQDDEMPLNMEIVLPFDTLRSA